MRFGGAESVLSVRGSLLGGDFHKGKGFYYLPIYYLCFNYLYVMVFMRADRACVMVFMRNIVRESDGVYAGKTCWIHVNL